MRGGSPKEVKTVRRDSKAAQSKKSIFFKYFLQKKDHIKMSESEAEFVKRNLDFDSFDQRNLIFDDIQFYKY